MFRTAPIGQYITTSLITTSLRHYITAPIGQYINAPIRQSNADFFEQDTTAPFGQYITASIRQYTTPLKC